MAGRSLAPPVAAGIRRMLESHRRARGRSDEELLLFTGSWHDSIPRRLILAPDLTPKEKIVWQVIYTHCARPGVEGAWPSIARIARLARISRPTVHNAIDVLQIKRWMIVSRRVRDETGAVIGNFYLLHPEPLSLEATLALDPGYLSFLRRMAAHDGPSKARVRMAARQELMKIERGRVEEEPDELARMERNFYCGVDAPSEAARAVVRRARERTRRRDGSAGGGRRVVPEDVRKLRLPDVLAPWEEEARALLARAPADLREAILEQVEKARDLRNPPAYLNKLVEKACCGEFLPPRESAPGVEAMRRRIEEAKAALARGWRVLVKGRPVERMHGDWVWEIPQGIVHLGELFKAGKVSPEDIVIEEPRAPP